MKASSILLWVGVVFALWQLAKTARNMRPPGTP
jgi:hypothetical protein